MKQKGYLDMMISWFDRYPRHYYVFWFFLLFCFFIIVKVFSYTVVNHDFYEKLAYNQQVGEVKLPVSRGTLFSSTSSGTVIGTSVNLYDLAIDPTMEGDEDKLRIFLTDTVYKQLCYLQSQKICYNGMLKFLKVIDIPEFTTEEAYVKQLIDTEIRARLTKRKVEWVLVASEVAPESLATISQMWIIWIYIDDIHIYANPEEINAPEIVAAKIAPLIWVLEKDLAYGLRQRDRRYIPIVNKLSITNSEEIQTYIQEEKDAIKKWILREEDAIYPYLILSSNPHRLYPEKDIASQVIGFVDSDGEGHYGVEGYFNSILKGKNSEILSKKDIMGRIIDPIRLEEEGALGEGADIYLTIDRTVQKKVEEILAAGVEQYKANKGTVVIMNPKTGKVIAMANYPSYDLNYPGDVYELEKVNYGKYPNPETDLLWKVVFVEDSENGEAYYYNGKEIFLRQAEREEYADYALVKYKYKNDFGAGVYKNDAISSLYEPGSIMKAITVAIWLDSEEITPYSMYNDQWKVTIDNFTISNVSEKCIGYHSFAHALNYSCNVGMIRIAQRYGSAIAYEYLNRFGFSDLTGISLDGEVRSSIENYEKWSKAKLYTSSYGLWVSVTPLQMAAAYSVLANGGVYVKPKIVDKVVYSNGKTVQYKPEISHRVVRPETSRLITSMLVDSVESGVAQNGRVPGFTIAGKTGTSQIAYKGKYETWLASTIGSFAGYAPAEDPQFVMIVKIERPRLNEFGGATSAFVFRDIAKYLFDYYGIPSKDS